MQKSSYKVYDESLALMKEIDQVVESSLGSDEEYTSAFEESLAKSAAAISEEYSSQVTKLYATINKAIKQKDFNTAQREITNMENLVRQWNSKLKALPPETPLKSVIKNTIKIILVIVGLVLTIGGPYMVPHFLPPVLMKLIGRGAPVALASTKVASAIAFTGEIGVSLGGMKVYLKNLTSLLTDRANKKIFNKKHGDEKDPNVHNGKYVAEVLVTDEWLKTIQKLKKKLQDMQEGKK